MTQWLTNQMTPESKPFQIGLTNQVRVTAHLCIGFQILLKVIDKKVSDYILLFTKRFLFSVFYFWNLILAGGKQILMVLSSQYIAIWFEEQFHNLQGAEWGW